MIVGMSGDRKDRKLHLLLEKSRGKSVRFPFFFFFLCPSKHPDQSASSVSSRLFFISASEQTFRDEEEGEWEGQTGSKDFLYWIKKRKVSGLAASRTQRGVAGLTG